MTEQEIQEKIKKYKININTQDHIEFDESVTLSEIINSINQRKIDPSKYNEIIASFSEYHMIFYYQREKTKEEILREIEIYDKKYEKEKTKKVNNKKRNEILKLMLKIL